jgi:hypothetical protein
MVLCDFYGGVPLNARRKLGKPPVQQHGLFELIIAPLRIRAEQYL